MEEAHDVVICCGSRPRSHWLLAEDSVLCSKRTDGCGHGGLINRSRLNILSLLTFRILSGGEWFLVACFCIFFSPSLSAATSWPA